LDPAADKVAVAALVIFLVARGELPLWGAVVVLARDVGILIGAVAMVRDADNVPQAGKLGKVTAVALAVMVLVHVADWQIAEPIALWCAMILVVLSGSSYARSMLAMRAQKSIHLNPDGEE
jgi:phosphatidylglycerophosphate synthase